MFLFFWVFILFRNLSYCGLWLPFRALFYSWKYFQVSSTPQGSQMAFLVTDLMVLASEYKIQWHLDMWPRMYVVFSISNETFIISLLLSYGDARNFAPTKAHHLQASMQNFKRIELLVQFLYWFLWRYHCVGVPAKSYF